MDEDGGGIRWGPLRIRTVRGTPYQVGGRTLIPVARIVSFGKARATVGAQGSRGQGGGLVWIQPLAVLEQTGDGERRIPLSGGTTPAVWSLVGLAVVVALCFATVRRLARQWHRSRV